MSSPNKLHINKPKWLKSKIPSGENYFEIKRDLKKKQLATVCEEAKCPNIGECWNARTATFMVMGEVCTRACRFCHVKTGNPQGWLDENEPAKVADSCKKMGLEYAVITMVDRDDLPDGGAAHVARVVEAVKHESTIKIEALTGDFSFNRQAIDLVVSSKLDVFAHNIETVESLSPRVRDARAKYQQSLEVLAYAKKSANHPMFTKSALMLGLGEKQSEVEQSLRDLRAADVDFITIGQYMRPTKKHLAIKEWVPPNVFKEYETLALDLGFISAACAPLVRSSYKAHEFYKIGYSRKYADREKERGKDESVAGFSQT